MSLRNFHVDANMSDAALLRRSDGFIRTIIASFRQMAANGAFTFGGVKLQDVDLNRLHAIVTEIDSRRLFYACGEDEIPRHAMKSLYDVRDEIRRSAKGLWANPSCEVIVQEIVNTLNDFCTRAEKLNPEALTAGSPGTMEFMLLMTDMRLRVWLLVAYLKKKIGNVLQPRNLPPELYELVSKESV